MKGRQDCLTAVSPIAINSVVEGTVSGITNFGAFVMLPTGQTGLVHISEVADVFVRDVNEFLKVQDKVTVKVLSFDQGGKIALSIKQADPGYRPVSAKGRDRRPGTSFEDKLSRFLKDSEDRMTDLRRVEGKRGGRGGRQGSGD
jgi:S1 RNA binding domain protein